MSKKAPTPPTPLKPEDFLILMVLNEGERHGYGIMKEVEQQSGGEVTLGIGSLYRLLGRMMRAGLVASSKQTGGERRRDYRLTPLGERALRDESKRLAELVERARSKGLLAQ
jgi:DNA-binding PadR family transcriptional regulator